MGATLRSWPDHIKVTVRSNQMRALTIYVVTMPVASMCYHNDSSQIPLTAQIIYLNMWYNKDNEGTE